MTTDEKGRRVPDYLRMILMCERIGACSVVESADARSAKVYSKPLNLPETPLMYAANLSARFGNEVSSREIHQPGTS